ncbi:MAG: type II toxin-antitoxin system VapC family toxin [Solirubrobacteraceae bacterium]|nr:type II toxin-antitoxin system VapC family toxin [Solirubrobacteraceae bacterium]
MLVVDASVVVDFLLGRPSTLTAVGEEMAGREHEPWHVPEVLEPETLSALRRLARTGEITEERAAGAVTDLGRLRAVRYPHAPLRARVWSLRHELTPHDAAYLALAEGLDAKLLTGDAGMAARAVASLGAARVRHVL